MKPKEIAWNAKCLFSFLSDDLWAKSSIHDADKESIKARLGLAGFEYLLRFCEVNRVALISRLKSEKCALSTDVLIARIFYLLILKWESSKDYRFLNTLSKYQAYRYQNYLPNDSAGIQLKNKLKEILRMELSNGK